jgi:hypothetical protein
MRHAAALIVLALLAPAAASADPTPIPQSDTDTPYIGGPATPNPISSPDPPRHPHMAPNARSNLHVDAYQTDANQGPGPLGVSPQVISTFYSNVCGSITFDSQGRIVTICVGLAGPTLRMLDPKTLDELASFRLPPRGPPNPAHPSPFNDFGGGGYFYLDDQDRAVLPTTNGHIYVVKETAPAGFALEHDYDLSALTPFPQKIFSALPDWSGRLWFVTTGGAVGFVDPQTGGAKTYETGEEIANSFAIDELGGIYLVTDKALYRFGVGADGKPVVTWRTEYPNSGVAKPGQVDAGSGTTPTITPRGFVAITDNADPMDVVLYDRRDGHQICSVPVFDKGASASDNSLVSFNDALIVENNFGYSGPTATEQGKSTTPGVARVDYDPESDPAHPCNVTWRSDEISPTVVPKVSLANGLLYLWTKPAGDGADPWYLTALDARTGKLVYKQLAGTGLGFNNNYAPITLGPDGTLYQGVLGGMVAIRDAVPPPGAAPPPAASPTGCRLLGGPSVRPRGRDLRLIPDGLADVTITRVAARHGFVHSKRVASKGGVRAPRTVRGRRLRDGTYVVAFRSGTSEVRRVVVTRRHGRFRRGPGPIDLAAGCGRASLSAPLFGRGGLTVRISSVDTAGAVSLVATRIGRRHRGVRPDRVRGTPPLTARLRLAPGTWHVAITIHGRRIGTLVARRPR